MTTLFLVRHGMTDAVGRSLVGRAPGIPLNADGVAQMDALACRLAETDFAAAYSSPLERAVQSATAIAKMHGLGVIRRPALTDVDFGRWTHKTLHELRDDPEFARFNETRSLAAPPSGEHAIDVQRRMVLELTELAAAHPGRQVLVVSHADPLRAAIAYLLGMPLDLLPRLELDPGSLSRVALSPARTCVCSLNEPG